VLRVPFEAGALEDVRDAGALEGAREEAFAAGALDVAAMEWNLFYIEGIGRARGKAALSLTTVSESR
jgi:hypothetical protein